MKEYNEKRIHKIWVCMKDRCSTKNKSRQAYQLYSSRNIKICNEWLESFENFKNWAINNGYKDNLSIDRIDVNGNYEPSNCRWATNEEQANNKRNNIKVEYNGEIHTLAEWAKILNINYFTFRDRIKRRIKENKPLNDAFEKEALIFNNQFFSKKVDQYDLNNNYIKTYPSMKEAERELGIQTTLISKCCRGIAKTSGGYKWKYHKD